MKKSDIEYLEVLVKRLKAYRSPTDAQQLIMLLAEKDDEERTSDDDKLLTTLIKAEKQAEKLAQARADARALIDAEKRKERRLDNQRKIIWGAMFRQYAQENLDGLMILRDLFEGYTSEETKELLHDDYHAIVGEYNRRQEQREC